VLPSWPERLCIALLPDRLAWVVLSRGRHIRAQGCVPVGPAKEGGDWHAVVEALQRELPGMPVESGNVSVVLSNAFVRYLVIQSSSQLTSMEERLALVRHDYQQVYGALAETWEIRLADGESRYLTAAIDHDLLAQLRDSFSSTRFKLDHVQPHAVAAFNHWIKLFNDKSPEGIFMVEPHGYCYAGIGKGDWKFVRCGRWEGTPLETFQRVVQRETLRTGNEMSKVWFSALLEKKELDGISALEGVELLPLDNVLKEASRPECMMAVLGSQ